MREWLPSGETRLVKDQEGRCLVVEFHIGDLYRMRPLGPYERCFEEESSNGAGRD